MADAAFDPTRYVGQLDVKNKDGDVVAKVAYMEVKWRIVWLRSDYPDAVIKTEPHTITGDSAVFRCEIYLPNGASATGYGSEDRAGWRDFIEKAETKAIGRACSLLGYGTQFATDHDHGGYVDSPVRSGTGEPTPSTTEAVSPKQVDYIRGLQSERGLTNAQMREITGDKLLADLTRAEASGLIKHLQSLPAVKPSR